MDIKINEICRICLTNNTSLINIFQNDIPNNIMLLTSHKIACDDGYPQSICTNCLTELNSAITFKNKCESSYIKLCDYFRNISAISPNSSIHETNVDTQYDIKLKAEHNKPYRIKIQEIKCNEMVELINLYECVTCSKHVLSFEAFKQHICDIGDIDNSIHVCNICSTKCISMEVYKKHLKDHQEVIQCDENYTSRVKNSKKNSLKKRKVQQCELCGKITQFQSQLIRHMRVHNGERPFKCNLCNKTFRLKAFLSKHLRTHSQLEPTHHCLHCPKSFVTKSSLNEHIKSHTNEKKYICNICNKKFKTVRNLQNHIKLHTGERNYSCNFCEKAFVNPFDLRRHEKLHKKYEAIQQGTYDKSVEPPKQLHQCEHCGKFISNRSDLKKHMRIHTKERPYSCETCGKTFAGSSALSVHIRTHTGIKPYACHHCGLSFTQSSNLKVHIRLHTGLKLYRCTICDKQFKRNRDLNMHLKRHENDNL